jgi:hypothetical protein
MVAQAQMNNTSVRSGGMTTPKPRKTARRKGRNLTGLVVSELWAFTSDMGPRLVPFSSSMTTWAEPRESVELPTYVSQLRRGGPCQGSRREHGFLAICKIS